MWNELGISGGTAIVILIALYFVIKWAVKNGIKEAYSAINIQIAKRPRKLPISKTPFIAISTPGSSV